MTLCISCCDSCIACALIDLAKWVIGWACGAIIASSLAKSPVFQQLVRSHFDLKIKKYEQEKKRKNKE